ncbi:hypothetical protein EJB05_29333, partial [Eragrostis curvula]
MGEATPPTEKKLSGETSPCADLSGSGIGRLSYRKRLIFYTLRDPDPDGTVFKMLLVSVLYALLTPWLLSLVADQPTTSFVWTTSLLAGSYFFVGTVSLSQTMRLPAVFFRFSYAAMLAVAGAHFVGPVTGAAVACLSTFYAAGTFGHAVAEHRQRVGTETSAGAVVPPPFRNEEHRERREAFLCYAFVQFAAVSFFVLARMVWVVFFPACVSYLSDHGDEALAVAVELSFETLGLAWLWIFFVAVMLLEQALASFKTVACLGIASLIGSLVLSCVVSIVLGDRARLLVMWLLSMAAVGFFGYCLAVHARYKQIQQRGAQLYPQGGDSITIQ